MCIDYNPETMKFVYYQNGEIEIVEDDRKNNIQSRQWHFNFRNIYQLAEAINTARPELKQELIELLKVI